MTDVRSATRKTGEPFDTSSAIGRMVLTMLAGFAEFERSLTSERTRLALPTGPRWRRRLGHDAPYGSEHDSEALSFLEAEHPPSR